jgi:hypothetical protein
MSARLPSRKNKSRDTSTPTPDNVSTFMGVIRSACGGFRYNVEILKQNDNGTWTPQPAQAILRGSMHKRFFKKDLPSSLTERLILVENSELGKLTSNFDPTTGAGNKKKIVIILYCYTKDEIKQLDRDEKLPPNFISYTDSNKVATGEKINLNDDNDVIIDFDDNSDNDDNLFNANDNQNANEEQNSQDEQNSEDELDNTNNNKDLSVDITSNQKKNKNTIKKSVVKKKKKSSNSRNTRGGAGWFESI